MSHIRKVIVYFDSPGPKNTQEVLRLAKERAEELNTEPGVQQMSDENRKKVKKNRGRVLTCIHAFSGVERAIRNKFGTAYPLKSWPKH